MTHVGFYIDEEQPPRAAASHTSSARRSRRRKQEGRPRPRACRTAPGATPRPTTSAASSSARRRASSREEPRAGHRTNPVTIANFLYLPGDRSLSGADGRAGQVKQGTPLTFLNADQALNIRHSVTTCPWPCNGPYVANYPLADGDWDSGTLGYDLIDGGSPNPIATTPPDLAVGVLLLLPHPSWMRGAFEVVPQ